MICSYVFSSVRFLNACTYTYPVSVCIDGRSVSSPFSFGEATEYIGVMPGTHTVTIRQACSKCQTLYSQPLFFSANEVSTFILLDSGRGMTLSRMTDSLPDMPNLSKDSGCYRMANLSYPNSNITVFPTNASAADTQTPLVSGLTFQAATLPQPFPCGNFSLHISEASGPLSFNYSIKIQPETLSTTYFIGNPWCIKSFLAVTLET